jgi:hypothetical protein
MRMGLENTRAFQHDRIKYARQTVQDKIPILSRLIAIAPKSPLITRSN